MKPAHHIKKDTFLKPAPPEKKLWRISMTGVKEFYVEAESEEDALSMECVEEEQATWGTNLRYEHESTCAEPIEDKEANRIRERFPKDILRDP